MSTQTSHRPLTAPGVSPASYVLVLFGAVQGCVLDTEPLGPNSGPEGYLPKFTATAQLEASQVVERNGNIGIGIDPPFAKLAVKGSASGGLPYIEDPDASLIAQFTASNAPRAGVLSIGGTNIPNSNSVVLASYQDPNSGLVFATRPGVSSSIAARMTITGAGNIGIGTTSPSDKLEVSEGNVRVSRLTSNAKTGLIIPSAGGVSRPICEVTIQGAITYDQSCGINCGHFFGCRCTSAVECSWAQLDP